VKDPRVMTPLITLTTDFGDASPYVAVMKGVILSLNPAARLLDLSHRIRPQDLRHADYFLGTAVPFFPKGTVHLAVIDPGVGSERAALVVEAGGQFLVGPDNGIFTRALRALGGPVCARQLTEPRFRLPAVSATFHGRDVFAPAAAHLSLGADPAAMGPPVPAPVQLTPRPHLCRTDGCEGEVQFVDEFGNLITNIPSAGVTALPVRVAVGGSDPHPLRWVRTYADAPPGELVSLFSSDGFFEVAVVNGSAARRLAADVGTPVELHFG
jgi:S-adenosylmethionine hydrolase